MIRVNLIAAVAALVVLAGASAQAQSACGKRAQVLEWLADTYREKPVAIGVTGTGALVEVVASGAGATWTILLTSPSGRSCLLAAGEGWRVRPPIEDDPEA